MASTARPDLSDLHGKSVLVVGGASGVGLAIAKRFAEAHAHITIADINDNAGAKVAEDLNAQGFSTTFVRCDVSLRSSRVEAFEYAVRQSPTKSIDVVALIAGVVCEFASLVDKVIASHERKDTLPEDLPHACIDVNLLGVFQCAYMAMWYMSKTSAEGKTEPAPPQISSDEKASPKSLIFISSTVAYGDVPSYPDYQASKFGVRGLFRGLRHQTPRLNIRCNCLAPYMIDTPLVADLKARMAKAGRGVGKGMHFVDVQKVVDSAGRFATDQSLHGRVFGILPDPEGVVDLQDDEEGDWGGRVFGQMQRKRREYGDVI